MFVVASPDCKCSNHSLISAAVFILSVCRSFRCECDAYYTGTYCNVTMSSISSRQKRAAFLIEEREDNFSLDQVQYHCIDSFEQHSTCCHKLLISTVLIVFFKNASSLYGSIISAASAILVLAAVMGVLYYRLRN